MPVGEKCSNSFGKGEVNDDWEMVGAEGRADPAVVDQDALRDEAMVNRNVENRQVAGPGWMDAEAAAAVAQARVAQQGRKVWRPRRQV